MHFQKVVYNWCAVAGLVPKYTTGLLQPTKKCVHQSKSKIAPVNQGSFVSPLPAKAEGDYSFRFCHSASFSCPDFFVSGLRYNIDLIFGM